MDPSLEQTSILMESFKQLGYDDNAIVFLTKWLDLCKKYAIKQSRIPTFGHVKLWTHNVASCSSLSHLRSADQSTL
jgi:hypothetical protein